MCRAGRIYTIFTCIQVAPLRPKKSPRLIHGPKLEIQVPVKELALQLSFNVANGTRVYNMCSCSDLFHILALQGKMHQHLSANCLT